MKNLNVNDMRKPTIITGQAYNTKVSVEIEYSDTSLNEICDAFETIVVGLGYSIDSWKQLIMEKAEEYEEENKEKWDDSVDWDNTISDGIWVENSNEDIEWPEPNETLIDARKQYEDLLKMNAKKSEE